MKTETYLAPTADGHALSEVYAVCLGAPETDHEHAFCATLDEALTVAMNTISPTVTLLSADLARPGEILATVILAAWSS
jgi:hypothetical protein